MYIEFLILLAACLLIVFRNQLPIRPSIGITITIAACTSLLITPISPRQFQQGINMDVLAFLWGILFIGQGLLNSHLINPCLKSAQRLQHHPRLLLALIMLVSAVGSAVLMNDTIAVIAPIPIILLCQPHRSPTPYLIGHAIAVTQGSLLTPIGNPQNLLVTLRASIHHPFAQFFHTWWLPASLGLTTCYALLCLTYNNELQPSSPSILHVPKPSWTRHDWASGVAVIIFLFGMLQQAYQTSHVDQPQIALFHWALLASLPLLLISQQRLRLLAQMDWATLIFFFGFFVCVTCVQHSSGFQALTQQLIHNIPEAKHISWLSFLSSHVISNVPAVSLFLPLLQSINSPQAGYIMLCGASTLAGNTLITGAASNIIIAQQCEHYPQARQVFHWRPFTLIGLTTSLVTWLTVIYF